jgi:hypothetical protein
MGVPGQRSKLLHQGWQYTEICIRRTSSEELQMGAMTVLRDKPGWPKLNTHLPRFPVFASHQLAGFLVANDLLFLGVPANLPAGEHRNHA